MGARGRGCPGTSSSRTSRREFWSPPTCLVVAWTLSASTSSSTTTCLRTLTHTCTELLGLAGLVPRVWPSPLSVTSPTRRPSTRCKRGLRWTSRSCLMRLISHHTSRDDKSSGIVAHYLCPCPRISRSSPFNHKVFHHLI